MRMVFVIILCLGISSWVAANCFISIELLERVLK